MNVLLIRDVFLVEVVELNLLLAVRRSQELEEISLKLAAVVADELLGILAHDEHLSDVGLRLSVHLEAILIAHLALAHLAVPSQPLKSLGLELVVQILRRSYFSFRHLDCGDLDVQEVLVNGFESDCEGKAGGVGFSRR